MTCKWNSACTTSVSLQVKDDEGTWSEYELCTVYVVSVNEVTICKPTGTEWIALPWDEVLLEAEPLRIKANITPSLPPGADFSIDVTARTSYTNPTGITVILDQISDGGSVLGGTTSTSSLVDSSGGSAEFTSADNASGSGSNFNDSDQFDSDMASNPNRKQRGKARNGGNENASPPEGGVSKTFMQAAGVEYIEVIYNEGEATEKKDKNQIENQADWFYYSGHGHHWDNEIDLYPSGGRFGPPDASGHWDSDLSTVIIAGCSVLDINDYNGNYSGAEHERSPGEEWILLGPNIFLGYNYAAPRDDQGSGDIIHTWYNHLYSDETIGAWKIANDKSAGRNACAIDLRFGQQKYYYFRRHIGWYEWVCEEAPW